MNKAIFQGQSFIQEFARSVDGVITPSSDYSKVFALVFLGNTSIAQFAYPPIEGYLSITATSIDGQYQLICEPSLTKDWKIGQIVSIELIFLLSSSNVRKAKKVIGTIHKSEFLIPE